MFEMVVYLVVGLALYLFSDWLLNQIEARRGKRLENRSVVFFGIILVLAVVSFNLLGYYLG